MVLEINLFIEYVRSFIRTSEVSIPVIAYSQNRVKF